MSQGTRAHQIALYIVYDAPLVMLCDSPSAYLEDPVTTSYIASIPSVFNSTRILDGSIGESIVSLREKDGLFYLGALTNWEPRDLALKLDFLPEGKWKAHIYRDGVNADITATDHVIETVEVNAAEVLNLHLAPGGGCAIIFEK